MDEADLLGDRIAIMTHGHLRTCGTSNFLKSRFGVGFHMTMEVEEHSHSEAVQDLVVQHLPEASVRSFLTARSTEKESRSCCFPGMCWLIHCAPGSSVPACIFDW
jgi:ATP-binding cassette subfamily A (ABC1) protein 3